MKFKNMIHLQNVSTTNHQLIIVEDFMETLLLPFVWILELRTGVFIPRVAKNPNHKITANLSLDILMMTKIFHLTINWFYLYCTTPVYLNSFWLANKTFLCITLTLLNVFSFDSGIIFNLIQNLSLLVTLLCPPSVFDNWCWSPIYVSFFHFSLSVISKTAKTS